MHGRCRFKSYHGNKLIKLEIACPSPPATETVHAEKDEVSIRMFNPIVDNVLILPQVMSE